MLEKTCESPLDCKEIKLVYPKGNQPWIFIGRTDAEAETPILWPPDMKNQLIGKDPDVGKDWGQEEKGATDDEMVEWQHWLNGDEFEQTLGDSEGQLNLACCSPLGCKELDRTEELKKKKRIKLNIARTRWSVNKFTTCQNIIQYYLQNNLIQTPYNGIHNVHCTIRLLDMKRNGKMGLTFEKNVVSGTRLQDDPNIRTEH